MAKTEPEKEPLSAPGVLAGLVPDDRIAAYEKLCLHGDVPREQAAGLLGSSELVQELTGLGLAYLIPHTATSPAILRAAPLDCALMGALGATQARLAREQELVLKGNQTLLQLQAQARQQDGTAPEHQLRVLNGTAEVLEAQRELAARARRDWMVLDNGRTDMPITEDYTLGALPALREQVRQRTIYDARLLEDPAVMRCIRQSVEAGEIAATLPRVEARLLIVDEIAVMVPFGWTGSAGAAVIYAEPTIKLARDLFELKWARSTPLGGRACDGGPLSSTTIRILELLAEGKSDASVAKVIERGKSTVQRHLEPAIALLGLESPSRFQLGFAVARAGLLGTPESCGRSSSLADHIDRRALPTMIVNVIGAKLGRVRYTGRRGPAGRSAEVRTARCSALRLHPRRDAAPRREHAEYHRPGGGARVGEADLREGAPCTGSRGTSAPGKRHWLLRQRPDRPPAGCAPASHTARL